MMKQELMDGDSIVESFISESRPLKQNKSKEGGADIMQKNEKHVYCLIVTLLYVIYQVAAIIIFKMVNDELTKTDAGIAKVELWH